MKNELIQVELNSCWNNWAIKENLVFNFSISGVLYLTMVHLSSKKAYKDDIDPTDKIDTELDFIQRWPFYKSLLSAVSLVHLGELRCLRMYSAGNCWYKGVCSWSVAEGGKEITVKKPFVVFCQQVSLSIAPSTSLWKNCSSFDKLASVLETPAMSASCSSSLPQSLSYWFLYFKCILYNLE